MSGCILEDREAHRGGYYIKSQHLQTQGGQVYFLAVSPLPLPHLMGEPDNLEKMPRNSSFVIICASQAYRAGQEKLPEHLRSKNVSTLTSSASFRKFTGISPTQNQTSVSGSHKAAAPASSPPCPPQKGRKPQGNTSGPAQCGGSPVKISREGALQLLVGFCSLWSPGQRERLWEGQPQGLAGKESSLMVNVSLSKTESTSFHGAKVKCGVHTASHGSGNAASAWTL